MKIVEEHSDHAWIEVDQQTLDHLSRHHIMSFGEGGHRWRPGDRLHVVKDAPFERCLGVYEGHHLPQWGSFSYSFSFLPIGMRVGRYCSIAGQVRIMGPRHRYEFISSSEILYGWATPFRAAIMEFNPDHIFRPDVQKEWPIIGHDVWIGQDVLLARGISIGDGAVVAGGSVVVKDVAPYSIVGGNPAKFIKWRFPEVVIERLSALHWWDYALPQFSGLSLEDPLRFIGQFSDLVEAKRIQPLLPVGRTWDVLTAGVASSDIVEGDAAVDQHLYVNA
jgi:virginiamycin A acetyltransferase